MAPSNLETVKKSQRLSLKNGAMNKPRSISKNIKHLRKVCRIFYQIMIFSLKIMKEAN